MPFSQLDVLIPKPRGHGYTEEPQTVGNHLRNKRLILQLEQTQVAELLGLNYRTYASWEIRGVKPDWKYFPKIIQFLGYNPFQPDTTISGKVKMCCILKGVSKLELSHLLGLDVRRLKDWEDGISKPKPEVQKRLRQILRESMKPTL